MPMAIVMTDDWTMIEYVREVLDDIRERLKVGAQGSGATLDADECVKVLACLRKANGRPRKDPEAFVIILKAGAKKTGATFDANTCLKILARLKTPLFPKGHPPGNDYAFIRLYCFWLEREGYPVEAAVKKTCKNSTLLRKENETARAQIDSGVNDWSCRHQ
jgi:hypothetical protein